MNPQAGKLHEKPRPAVPQGSPVQTAIWLFRPCHILW